MNLADELMSLSRMPQERRKREGPAHKPDSAVGRVREYLLGVHEGVFTSRQLAAKFDMPVSRASAIVYELKKQGRVRQVRIGGADAEKAAKTWEVIK